MSTKATFLVGLFILSTLGCTVYDGPYEPRVATEVRVDFFYDHLAAYGDWVLVEAHGWVWVPYGVPVDWRPYTHGRWLYTSYGWTWYSSWDWGWAPFHYGRWSHHAHHGWIWVPGSVWGPGWVAWRSGGDWLGWAPLPPQVRWRVGVGLDLNGVDLRVGIASMSWSFIHTALLTEDSLRHHFAPSHRSTALLHSTQDITHYREQDRAVVESGVTPERVERALGQAVLHHRVEELSAPPRSHIGVLDSRAFRIYRPQVKGATPGRKPPRKKGKRGPGG